MKRKRNAEAVLLYTHTSQQTVKYTQTSMPSPVTISQYDPELAAIICDAISGGASVATACNGICDPATWYRWVNVAPGCYEMYQRARQSRAHARFESLDQVLSAMDAGLIDAAQARVKMDAIKWQTAKENAVHYGDKQQLELSGPGGGAVETAFTVRFVAGPSTLQQQGIQPALEPVTIEALPVAADQSTD